MINGLRAHPQLLEARFLGIALGERTPIALVALVLGSTYLAMKLSPSMGAGQQNEQTHKTANMALLGIMLLFAFRYQAALSIYIISANVFGALERFLVRQPQTDAKGAKSK